jgi:hypothetical protein
MSLPMVEVAAVCSSPHHRLCVTLPKQHLLLLLYSMWEFQARKRVFYLEQEQEQEQEEGQGQEQVL